MKRAMIAGAAFVAVLVLVALAVGRLAPEPDIRPATTTPSPISPTSMPTATETDPGFLYGRIHAADGTTYEGRLRFGGTQEAFWGDYFNGAKDENTWAAHVRPERLPRERYPFEVFGFTIAERERLLDLDRLFMARFGDIARIEAQGRDVRVTLKSGMVLVLDRFEASDFDDGVRVWDERRGTVDLDSLQIRSIELFPTPSLGTGASRLHGTVRTRRGTFTGFVQWDREECVGSDELDGRTADGELNLRFDAIRSIERRSNDSSVVTVLDGIEVELSGTNDVGEGNRGLYVDDPRYGRVLVSWDAFERVDFGPGGNGPAYGDFPPGRPLTGTVTTRTGSRLTGRLVFDLDESETIETLDAPSEGVDYTIPFGLIASIDAPRARVTLHSGEELSLERAGDLGERNAGLLIFVDGRDAPEYLPWPDVEQIELDRPPAAYPPIDER